MHGTSQVPGNSVPRTFVYQLFGRWLPALSFRAMFVPPFQVSAGEAECSHLPDSRGARRVAKGCSQEASAPVSARSRQSGTPASRPKACTREPGAKAPGPARESGRPLLARSRLQRPPRSRAPFPAPLVPRPSRPQPRTPWSRRHSRDGGQEGGGHRVGPLTQVASASHHC
jgi:hypothetical protein